MPKQLKRKRKLIKKGSPRLKTKQKHRKVSKPIKKKPKMKMKPKIRTKHSQQTVSASKIESIESKVPAPAKETIYPDRVLPDKSDIAKLETYELRQLMVGLIRFRKTGRITRIIHKISKMIMYHMDGVIVRQIKFRNIIIIICIF